ncbi:uncharacterized protein LOC117507842 [Thalassophryne amazonica]|uniref:uncharacterized protein LOC117507842 n=1 Tax=Thalassophryne amazonica TaxID=390379 RepID=UPI0014714744|nr:uncharacterized protein LOC117507842 [Thalassophryne amazonica]
MSALPCDGLVFCPVFYTTSCYIQQLLVNKADVLLEQQEENHSVDQKDSEAPNIKEEQEELWNEDGAKIQSSQLQSQRDQSTEVEFLSSISTPQRTRKIKAKGEDCGGPEPASNSDPCSHLQPHTDDMQQLLFKEEILSEQQDWNVIVDQEDIKDDEEKLWISQQLEEADVTDLPSTAVPVKSENEDEKPQSSQVNTEVEPVASSSTTHRTLLIAQAVGEDYGGSRPASIPSPNSYLQPGTTGRSSEGSKTETNISCEWKQTNELHSGFNCQTNNNDSVYHSRCNVTEKHFNSCHCGKPCGQLNNEDVYIVW